MYSKVKTPGLGVLMSGASVLVLGVMATAMPAAAQTTPAAGKDDSTVVVVTGQRQSLKSAQKTKKDAETVVDSITATDIGALPDRSVSEALQRVVGVSLQRTNEAHDPARLSGEGGAIFVRGLSYVSTLVNGREVFGASNGRTIGFEDVSADLMARVDVFKGSVADQIEGELGGTVDLVTRKPFDSKKRILAFTANSTYGDLRKKAFYSGSFTYSDRWTTGAGELGLLVNVSHSDEGTRTNSESADRFDSVTGTDAGQGLCNTGDKCVPKAMGFRTIDWEQKRDAYNVVGQWRPNDQWELTLSYLDTKATPKDLEHATGISDNLLVDNPTYVYNSNGMFQSGVINDANLYNDTRSTDVKRETSDLSLHGVFKASDKLTITGDLQSVKSSAQVTSFTVGTQTMGAAISDVAVDFSGKLPSFTFYQNNYFDGTTLNPANKVSNAPAINDPTNYYYSFAMDHLEDNDATDQTGRLDAEYDFDSGWMKSLKVGVRATDKHSITRENGYNWGAISQDAAWNGNNITNDPPLPNGGTSGYYNFDNFFRGDTTVQGSYFPPVVLADYYKSRDALKTAAADLGWGWVPFDGNYASAGYGRADNVASGIIDQREKTTAVYGVIRFGADSFFGSGKTFDGNFGIRAIRTDLSNGNASVVFPSAIDTSTTTVNPNLSATDQKAYTDAITISQAGGGQNGLTAKNHYTDILPSFNLRLHMSDTFQARLAVYKSIVRPSFSQMSPFTTLGIATTSVDSDPPVYITNPMGGPDVRVKYFNSVQYNGNGGNPDLKPMRATSEDISLEWYPAATTSLTLAVFNKSLTNFFYGATGDEAYTVGGITKTYSVFRTRNGLKGSIKGFELAYSQFYDFLPGAWAGLGLQANYTHIDDSGGGNTPVGVSDPDSVKGAANSSLPLEGLSPNSYNVAVMYEKYGISGRLAYNWRSEYLLTTSAANVKAPVWAEAYGQLDGSLLYSVTPQIKIGVQATNLLKAKTYLQVGNPGRTARYNWLVTDQQVAFVVRGAF